MRRIIFTLIAFSFILSVSAQTAKPQKKKAKSHWKSGGTASLSFMQGGARNAAFGGEKFSVSFSGQLYLWANRKVGLNNWENQIDLGYALTNAHTSGLRKSDDKFDFVTKFTHKYWKKSGIGVWGNVRGQMTNGYDFTESPKQRISGFFAPAYVTAAVGLNYMPWKNFSLFAGAANRWIIVTNSPYSYSYQGGVKPDGSAERSLAEKYGVDPERRVRFDIGPFVSASLKKELCKNLTYRGRADFLSDLVHGEPTNIDIYWSNYFSLKVNKWLQVQYNFDFTYDDDVEMFGPNKRSPAAQLKSVFGVGIMGRF